MNLVGWPEVRYNDCGVDVNGALWVGSMNNSNLLAEGIVSAGKGKIYRIDSGQQCSRVLDGIGVANTLVWNPQETIFYTADSLHNSITSYSFDRATGTLDAPRPLLLDYIRGKPDGSAMDQEGSIWNCRYGGSCIVRISPSGVIQNVIEMPTLNVTSCAFGGKDLRTLYVTTAVSRNHATPVDGALFAVETEVKGKPVRDYTIVPSSYEVLALR